jgi:hypothetical protein
MENINDSYFDGIYKEVWKSFIPEILTQREVAFLETYFGLQPGMHVIDLMCGYGRHSIALARKGIHVTAVDNLESYIKEIKLISLSEGIPIQAIKTNVINFQSPRKANLTICMGNSINFYNKTEITQVLLNTRDSMLPFGRILINTWSLYEIVMPRFQPESKITVDDITCHSVSQLLENPNRIESTTVFLKGQKYLEEKNAIDYIYSIAEINDLLGECGFKMIEIFSIPGKKRFSNEDPRAYIIAEKIS